MNFNKILVIGSNSFTASNFISYALKKNKKIIGISRSKEYPNYFLSYKLNKNLKTNFFFNKIDINKDINKLNDIIKNFKPEVIVNFAAQGEVRNSWKNSIDWYQTNCLGVVNLTNLLIGNKFLQKYISISTPEVYGNSSKEIIENNNNFSPSTPYAASKLAGDLHLITLYKKYGFPVIFTRSSNVYGPFQQLYRIIPKTIINIKKNKKIYLHGFGKAKRNFIYIDDISSGIFNLLLKGKINNVYHFSSKGKEISIKDLISLICNIMDKEFDQNVNLIEENFGQDYSYKLNSNITKKNICWTSKVTLNEGILKTLKWIDMNWNQIKYLQTEYKHKK